MAEIPTSVKLHVYDLSRGLAKSMSMTILGKQLEGIWHTGILVYDEEYYFGGGGIESCPPCGTILGDPDEVVDLGETQVPQELFFEYLSALASERFRPENYHLFDHNCNNFSSEIAMFLTGNDIPEKILELPKEVGNTALGGMVRNLMESMGPRGGNNVFQLPHTAGANNWNTGSDQAGQSRENSCSSLSTSGDSKAESKQEAKFITFPVMASSDVYSDFRNDLVAVATEQEMRVLDEFNEYLSKDPKDLKWSVGPEHIRVLGYYVFTHNADLMTGCLSCLIGMLRFGCQRVEVQHSLARDPEHYIMKIFCILSYFQPSVQIELGKLLANCCAEKVTCDWLMKNTAWPIPPKQTCNCDVVSASYNALLQNTTTQTAGAAVIQNLSLQQLPDNFTTSLTQDLMYTLHLDLDDVVAQKCLETIDRLLSKVKKEALIRNNLQKLNMDLQRFSGRNNELGAICKNIRLKLGLDVDS